MNPETAKHLDEIRRALGGDYIAICQGNRIEDMTDAEIDAYVEETREEEESDCDCKAVGALYCALERWNEERIRHTTEARQARAEILSCNDGCSCPCHFFSAREEDDQ